MPATMVPGTRSGGHLLPGTGTRISGTIFPNIFTSMEEITSYFIVFYTCNNARSKLFQFSGFVVKAKTCFASFPEFFDEACQKTCSTF